MILRCASFLVPARQRAEWLAQWRSELWYFRQRRNPRELAFCLGAFRDALWVRRNTAHVKTPVLASPYHCIALLLALAAVSTFFAIRLSYRPKVPLAHFLMIPFALLILPVTTSFGLGEYPANAYAPAPRFRRWMFLGMKFALIIPIVFCGTLDAATVIAKHGIEAHATLLGYILAFRWVLVDQRRRCPVCLRVLTNPTRIGHASQTFLGWYGTELVCLKGHGLLHVPEIPNTYNTQRWVYLDPSWSSLFSSHSAS